MRQKFDAREMYRLIQPRHIPIIGKLFTAGHYAAIRYAVLMRFNECRSRRQNMRLGRERRTFRNAAAR